MTDVDSYVTLAAMPEIAKFSKTTFPQRPVMGTRNGQTVIFPHDKAMGIKSNGQAVPFPLYYNERLAGVKEGVAKAQKLKAERLTKILEQYDQIQQKGGDKAELRRLGLDNNKGEYAISNLIASLRQTNAPIMFQNIDISSSLEKLKEINRALAV